MPSKNERESGEPSEENSKGFRRGEEEWVPEDDRVIGVAFRWSLGVFLGVAIVAAILWFGLRPKETHEATIAAEPVAPQEIRATAEPSTASFVDVTAASGIDYVHFSGKTGEKLLPETMGGGGGFVDIDGDGLQDIVFIGGTSWPHDNPVDHPPSVVLFRNLGGGQFEDATTAWGLASTDFYGMGLVAADYDGDGRVDLFVTAVGENHLFRNTGKQLVDVTRAAGVGGAEDAWSTGATFFDADGDGDLDLFVGNYVEWSRDIDLELDYRLTGVGHAYGPPLNYQGTLPYLYRNEGNGHFLDISAQSGIQIRNPATDLPMAKSLAVASLDVDLDGHVDLLVANDTVQNFYYHNQGDGSFEESGEFLGVAFDREGRSTGAMGLDAGYFRNDDDLSFVIGNFANEMTSLYVSQGDATLFADEAITEGIGTWTRTSLTFGVLFFDYDLDGWLDLLQSNGHLEEEIQLVDPSQSYAQPTQLFWNSRGQGGRGLVALPVDYGGDLGHPMVGRGSTYADFDQDGDLDLLLFQVSGPPRLLRNDREGKNHWLRLQLVGKTPNTNAIGARVELRAGGITQRRVVSPVRSYLSQVELPLTFGLGQNEDYDSLTIYWPDGSREEIGALAIDQSHSVKQSLTP